MGFVRTLAVGVGAIVLSACETITDFTGDMTGGGGFARDSRYVSDVARTDLEILSVAFIEAMESGEAKSWRGSRAAGAITPAGWSLGNLQADKAARIPAIRGDFDMRPTLETELGLYVLTRNSNVRLGPGTDHIVAEKLSSGSGVDVVGKSVEEGWMLVAFEGAVRGYISPKLVVKAPGTELELAGGPRRQGVMCREFVQRLSVAGVKDQWRGAACKSPMGEWRLAPRTMRDDGPAVLLLD